MSFILSSAHERPKLNLTTLRSETYLVTSTSKQLLTHKDLFTEDVFWGKLAEPPAEGEGWFTYGSSLALFDQRMSVFGFFQGRPVTHSDKVDLKKLQ